MEDKDWNPTTNANVIAIVRQEDGNYKGYCKKFEKDIEVRAGDPQTVLTMLLTHE